MSNLLDKCYLICFLASKLEIKRIKYDVHL